MIRRLLTTAADAVGEIVGALVFWSLKRAEKRGRA